MIFAAHLYDRSNNSKLGVAYVSNSENSCGFGDGDWCFGRYGCEADVQATQDKQALPCASQSAAGVIPRVVRQWSATRP